MSTICVFDYWFGVSSRPRRTGHNVEALRRTWPMEKRRVWRRNDCRYDLSKAQVWTWKDREICQEVGQWRTVWSHWRRGTPKWVLNPSFDHTLSFWVCAFRHSPFLLHETVMQKFWTILKAEWNLVDNGWWKMNHPLCLQRNRHYHQCAMQIGIATNRFALWLLCQSQNYPLLVFLSSDWNRLHLQPMHKIVRLHLFSWRIILENERMQPPLVTTANLRKLPRGQRGIQRGQENSSMIVMLCQTELYLIQMTMVPGRRNRKIRRIALLLGIFYLYINTLTICTKRCTERLWLSIVYYSNSMFQLKLWSDDVANLVITLGEICSSKLYPNESSSFS